MTRKYAISGSATNGTNKTILGLTASTSVRAAICDVVVGGSGTPNDYSADYLLNRNTAAGTSTGVTPLALDPADPAALCTAGKAHSVEPTYTAGSILLAFSLNQRQTFRFVPQPGFEFLIPATASNGIGLYTTSASTAFTSNATILFAE